MTTFYLGGLWEEDSSSATKSYYSFNGQVVALREASGVSYLHSDHLGSISVVTNQAGAILSQQYFDPWGKVRAGGIGQTSLNYTGQRLDITGLLYYHARMHDPALGRFISADSVLPGDASGSMKGIALKPLTVDFHEVGFVTQLHQENQQPFWFQMNREEQQKADSPWGPANPHQLVTPEDIPAIFKFLDTPHSKLYEGWKEWREYWDNLDIDYRRRSLKHNPYYSTHPFPHEMENDHPE